MTENKRFHYNVNKNSIEFDGNYFAFCNGEQVKIVKKLNELNDKCEFLEIENESLEDGATKYAELSHKLLKENEQLKYHLNKTEKELQEYKNFMSLG